MDLQAINGRGSSMASRPSGVQTCEQVSLSCMMFANLAIQNKEARIAWTILAALSDLDLDIAAVPGGARQYWSWPHTDPKVLGTLAPRRRDPTDRVCAPSNGFRPPFM